jgi:uncharacterized membrane protein YoaK (UPF0700 family)
MNSLQKTQFYTVLAGGCILAVTAGFVNTVSLTGIHKGNIKLILGTAVSHTTGNIARFSIQVIDNNPDSLSTFALVFMFIFGSFTSGYIVGESKFKLGAPYGYCLALESGTLFIGFLCLLNRLFIGEYFMAFSCGLQNAMATSYSGMAIRTTHMTGCCTDIGNVLGQSIRRGQSEMWRVKVQIPILISFILGSMSGQIMWNLMDIYSLLIPIFMTGAVAFIYLTFPFFKDKAEKFKKMSRWNRQELDSSRRSLINRNDENVETVNIVLRGSRTVVQSSIKNLLETANNNQTEVELYNGEFGTPYCADGEELDGTENTEMVNLN